MLPIKSWIFLFLFIGAVICLIYFFPVKIITNNLTASLAESLDTANLVEISNTAESVSSDFVLAEETAVAVVVPQVPYEQQRQNIIDDIVEKLDIILQQAQELALQEEQDKIAKEAEEKRLFEENCAKENYLSFQCSVLKVDQDALLQQNTVENNVVVVTPVVAASSGGGGSSHVDYPKILISEVQILPTEQRFIELYNPNDQEVSLNDWYVQRKDSNDTSWGSLVSHTNFEGKTISAQGYFLISRELPNLDILSNFSLSNDNSLALKNPNGEISDKLGFGLALDFELLATTSPSSGQSIGRKFLDNTEQDTDNNSADFELNTPTPKAQNITYSEPPPPEPVTLESIAVTAPATKLSYFVGEELLDADIAGLEVTGFFSDSSTEILSITLDNITGFDTTTPSTAQVLTITFEEKTTEYIISIISSPDENPEPPVPDLPQLKIVYQKQQVIGEDTIFVFAAEASASVIDTTCVNLSSDPPTGSFSESSIAGSCITTWNEKISINIGRGDKRKGFCYKNSNPGQYTIIVSDRDNNFSSDSQIIDVIEKDDNL